MHRGKVVFAILIIVIKGFSSLFFTLGDRVFLAAAPKLWNGLPSQMRNEPNFHRFKGLLKTHFFRLAFY